LDSVTELITWCFLVTNTARVLAYVPQIRAAWSCTNGAVAVSRATWGYFAAAHLSGALYGLVVVHDVMMATIFLGNFVACMTLLGVIAWKRRQHRARTCRNAMRPTV